MTRFIPSLAVAAACVACVLQGIEGVRRFARPADATFLGPGEFTFRAPVTGEYAVWHCYSAVVDGVFIKNSAELPNGFKIEVRRANDIVPVKPGGSMSVTSGESKKMALVKFEATAAAVDYVITTSGLPSKHAFELTHGPVVIPLFAAIGWFMSAAALFLVTILLIVFAFVGIFPRKPKPNER